MSLASNGGYHVTNLLPPYLFPRDSFKYPWQSNKNTGNWGRESRVWHSHLQPVLNTALSPGQIAIPYVLLGQQCCGWEEKGLHSPWQTLLPACGTQEELLLQLEKKEKQDLSLIAVLGLTEQSHKRKNLSSSMSVGRFQKKKDYNAVPSWVPPQ